MLVVNKRGTTREIADAQLAEYKRKGYQPAEKATAVEPKTNNEETATTRSSRRNSEQ